MAHVSRHTGFTGSALTRLLSQLAGIDVRESRQAFADRLSQWLSWTDAIALSTALEGGMAATPSGPRASGSTDEDEGSRVRAALLKAITQDNTFTSGKPPGSVHATQSIDTMDAKAEFAPYRQRYLARQQTMEAAIGPLRGRLRAALANRSPAMARLAAVDTVMEQVLGPQENSLLSTIPSLLEKHFRRLREAHAAALADAQALDAPAGNTGGSGLWLEVFCRDMQAVLLAELELRFQPVEGLIEALRTRPSSHHE
jgi:hypothetical protein